MIYTKEEYHIAMDRLSNILLSSDINNDTEIDKLILDTDEYEQKHPEQIEPVPESTWNHRVIAHEKLDEVYLEIHEVYYTNSIPHSCTIEGVRVSGCSIEEIKVTLLRMLRCLNKPILTIKDLQEYDRTNGSKTT